MDCPMQKPQEQTAPEHASPECQALLDELNKTRALYKELDEIIEKAPDGIYITDGEANVLRVNAAFERITGVMRTEVLGRNQRDIMKEGLIGQSNVLPALERQTSVTILHDNFPASRQVLDTCIPVFNAEGDIIMTVSSVRDLTELNELRATLEQERAHRERYERQIEIIKGHSLQGGDLVIYDKKMLQTLLLAKRMTQVDSTVLLTGETGVGKEEIARYIHLNSSRRDGLFVEVNCGAISEHLAESELFGYEKGAFTGALQSGKAGLFEAANGGTLFLDEVGELPLDIQVKMLRALQTNTITRVGGTKTIPVNVRIIAATNQDLLQMVRQNRFREDVYYRLNVVPIHIPPLRDRPDDIEHLINHFLARFNERYKLNKSLSSRVHQTLLRHDWPGNVRELKNIVEHISVVEEGDVITMDALPLYIQKRQDMSGEKRPSSMREQLQQYEYSLIQEAYEARPNVRAAAEYLGMPVSTFVRRRKELAKKFAV